MEKSEKKIYSNHNRKRANNQFSVVDSIEPSSIFLFDIMNYIERFSIMIPDQSEIDYVPLSTSPMLDLMKEKVFEFAHVITSLGVPAANMYFIFDGMRDANALKKKHERQVERFDLNTTNVYPNASSLLSDYLKMSNKNFNVYFTSKSDADNTIIRLISTANRATQPREKMRVFIFSGDRDFEQSVCKNVNLVCNLTYDKIKGKEKEYLIKFAENKNLSQPPILEKYLYQQTSSAFIIAIQKFITENCYGWQDLYQYKMLQGLQTLGFTIRDVLIKKSNPYHHTFKFFEHLFFKMCQDSGSNKENFVLSLLEYSDQTKKSFFKNHVICKAFNEEIEKFLQNFLVDFLQNNKERKLYDFARQVISLNYGSDCFEKVFPTLLTENPSPVDISELNFLMFEIAELICLYFRELIYADISEYVFSLPRN